MNATSYPVQIFMAGNIDDAMRICRSYCFNVGGCVTVTPTTYVYSGGEEAGFIVGFINYPRFPKTPDEIDSEAGMLASMLAGALCQRSYTIQSPDETRWVTREMPFEVKP